MMHRYNMVHNILHDAGASYRTKMLVHPDGKYVLHLDAQYEIARLEAERDDWAYKFNESCNTYSEMHISLEKAEDERDAAIKALSEAATARGQAEGKLATSEMAGVVEGWKSRAKKAEAELNEGKREADYLANVLWERHYKNKSPNFELLNTVSGVVSQIDNMVAGIIAERDRALAKCDSLKEKLGTWMGRAGEAEARWYEALSLVEAVTERADSAEKSLQEALAHPAPVTVDSVLNAASDYMKKVYGIAALSHPVDRERIFRALPIDPDAQKALDKLLAQAREDAIREAAALCAPKKAKVTRGNRFTPSTKDPQSTAAQAARKQCHDSILALLNNGEQNE